MKLSRRDACVMLVTVALLILAGCGPGGNEGPALEKLIQDSQQAGFEKHDFDKYMAIWADDAKMIEGRYETPGKYDVVLDRAQIEATRKLRFKGSRPKDLRMEFSNAKSEVSGDTATVRYRATIRFSGGSVTADEIFRLRKKDGAWRVYENRSWLVKRTGSDYIEEFEDSRWKVLDEQVSRAEKAGDLAAHASALSQAGRMNEAHQVTRKWTEKSPKDLQAWLLRGEMAMEVGEAKDALASFKKALELDPKAHVPDWVHVVEKEK